jgi:hypothetical protein
MKLRLRSILILSGTLLVGCGRGNTPAAAGAKTSDNTDSIVASSPTPATPQTAPESVQTQPSVSTLQVGGQPITFGAAILRLTKGDGPLTARLYSDEPSGDLSGRESANSYDLQMELPDVSDPALISGAVWTSNSGNLAKQDSPYGIFLPGQKKILQPMNVKVSFAGQTPLVHVTIEGTFCMFNADDHSAQPSGTIVQVTGELQATVPAK